jgi:hypothetical protein
MSATRKKLAAAAVLLLAVTLGCNPLTAPFFFMGGPDEKLKPDFSLAHPPDDPNQPDKQHRDKPTNVAVLVSCGSRMPGEFQGIDRTLSSQFVRRLLEDCRMNKETIHVTKNEEVTKFKQNNPTWKTLSDKEIGERLNVDYLIDLEVHSMSLYEPGSRESLYRGQAQITVRVTDTHAANDEPAFQKEYECRYPRTNPESREMDMSPSVFREKFLALVVTDLVWMFTSHQAGDEHHRDQ